MTQPNPDTITVTISGLAGRGATIKILPERGAKNVPNPPAPELELSADQIAGAPPKPGPPLAPEFNGVCAARGAEALLQGTAQGTDVPCPEHGTKVGEPCLTESTSPLSRASAVDNSWVRTAVNVGENSDTREPDPMYVGHRRAFSTDPHALRIACVGHDPARSEPWLMRVEVDEGTDEAKEIATRTSREKWMAYENEIAIFWPVVLPDQPAPEATKAEGLEPSPADETSTADANPVLEADPQLPLPLAEEEGGIS